MRRKRNVDGHYTAHQFSHVGMGIGQLQYVHGHINGLAYKHLQVLRTLGILLITRGISVHTEVAILFTATSSPFVVTPSCPNIQLCLGFLFIKIVSGMPDESIVARTSKMYIHMICRASRDFLAIKWRRTSKQRILDSSRQDELILTVLLYKCMARCLSDT